MLNNIEYCVVENDRYNHNWCEWIMYVCMQMNINIFIDIDNSRI